ncbi:MAG: hypothetical protein WDN04_14765 [Rhodospirillales bacterium]
MTTAIDFIRGGNIEGLRLLLQQQPETAEIRTAEGASLLAFAAYCGAAPAVSLIRATRSDIDPFEAIIVGDADRVRRALAEGWSADARAPDGFTALGLAAFFRQAAIFDILLPQTSDLDARATNAQSRPAFQIGFDFPAARGAAPAGADAGVRGGRQQLAAATCHGLRFRFDPGRHGVSRSCHRGAARSHARARLGTPPPGASSPKLLRLAGKDAEARSADAAAERTRESASKWPRPTDDRTPEQFEKAEQRLRDTLGTAARPQQMTRLRDLLMRNSVAVAAMRLLAELEREDGDEVTAGCLLQRALDLAPGYTGARTDFARLLMDRQSYMRALAETRILIASAPRNMMFRAMHANALRYVGDFAAAIAMIEGMLEDDPRNPQFLCVLCAGAAFRGPARRECRRVPRLSRYRTVARRGLLGSCRTAGQFSYRERYRRDARPSARRQSGIGQPYADAIRTRPGIGARRGFCRQLCGVRGWRRSVPQYGSTRRQRARCDRGHRTVAPTQGRVRRT